MRGKLMGFFRNIKWLIEDLHENNKEFVRGVQNDLKEFKTDMKDLTKQCYPKIGEAIEKVDRAVQTIKNTGRSLPNSNIPTTVPVQRFNPGVEEKSPKSLLRGDHIYVKRIAYEHHGLFIGNNQIIHYSNGSVRREYLEAMDSRTNLSNVRVKNSACI